MEYAGRTAQVGVRNMEKVILRNNVEMPSVIMGTSVDDRKGSRKKLIRNMSEAVCFAVQQGLTGFDTSRDYSNEEVLGRVFSDLIRSGRIKREDIFITTKVGNGQQRERNMEAQIDMSLKALKLDYVDLWLLHWPLPDYYIENWNQVCRIYNSGKARAIGIANCRERQIQIEAYSANCVMLPFVRENAILEELAEKYGRTITQVMMRWHVQQGIVPIFSSLNRDHILENIDIFDFSLEEDDMQKIYGLNCDYKFHPESLNCPGY